jgi:hypothetical protein
MLTEEGIIHIPSFLGRWATLNRWARGAVGQIFIEWFRDGKLSPETLAKIDKPE